MVDATAAGAWSAELGLSAQLRPQKADEAMFLDGLALLADGASPVASAASFSSLADTCRRVVSRAVSSEPKLRCTDGGVPLTALFTSGSTGIPKPRWMSESTWAQRTPKGTSVRRVTAVPVFSPLSHGLYRAAALEPTHEACFAQREPCCSIRTLADIKL